MPTNHKQPPYINGKQFSWAMEMLAIDGINNSEFCSRIGCHIHQPYRWKKYGAPKYVALCMVAMLPSFEWPRHWRYY